MMMEQTEVYFCLRSKAHRSLQPFRLADMWNLPDALVRYTERTQIDVDGVPVLLMTEYPIRSVWEVHFIAHDIREMRGTLPTKPINYVQAMLPFMRLYFGDTWAWSGVDGSVDALRITYELIVKARSEGWNG